jgi:methyl-accepting chemotaxis protein
MADQARMFKLFSRHSVAAPTPSAADAPPPDLSGAVRAIARQAAELGREAAEVRGVMDDTQQRSGRQAEALAALASQVQQVTQSQAGIATASQDSLDAVQCARRAVEDVGAEVNAIVASLRQVSEAAAGITQIALQTRLVAFNASVEAKHAGEAGRGFGAVADAVKDLATRVESSSKAILSTVNELDGRIEALSCDIRPAESAGLTNEPGTVHRALADVSRSVAGISEAARHSGQICAALDGQMGEIQSSMQQTRQSLDGAFTRSEAFLSVSERLIELVARCGVATDDTPYINAVREAAAQVGQLLDAALRTGIISANDLFDEQYQPIAGTQPQQHTTRFNTLADRLFPQVQERLLGLSDKVVFCIAVDRNGYVATHNRKYCQPQRGDLAWDTANSRYRRIFNDRTGLASARNQRPFLLQTYRRDMGGGRFVVMKEAAAPITADGRHWGGLRLAFHF